MSKIFDSVALMKPRRNMFDMSHDRKFSMDAGLLVPMFCEEVLPGDKFSVQSEQLLRLAPMVAPMMHKVDVVTHFFFVPNRILWNEWEDFITGGDDGTANPQWPYVVIDNAAEGSIPDYLGIPTGVVSSEKMSALPFAAYSAIYNEYYRDENLQLKIGSAHLVSGDNTTDLTADGLLGKPFKRAWEKDYFTSALPFPQKGPDVVLPLGDRAPIEWDNSSFEADRLQLAGNPTLASAPLAVQGGTAHGALTDTGFVGREYYLDNSKSLFANLAAATSSTINDFRKANSLQAYYEMMARGGSRYIEVIKSFFNVTSDDARLQRPEYLGGGKSPIMVSEVLQTSESVNTPQGNLAGHGVNLGQSNGFSREFKEHGYIIGIISVMPRPAYFQGLHKSWRRVTKLDYFWSPFADLGEQEIKNYELYLANDGLNDGTFGYQQRYAEYRFKDSSVHGDFRTSLDFWHWSRKFGSRPNLNPTFIECAPDKRIFAVQNLPDDGSGGQPVRSFHSFYCHMAHHVIAVRPLPMYGIPQL